jgi:SAM-dependent methyltransferase
MSASAPGGCRRDRATPGRRPLRGRRLRRGACIDPVGARTPASTFLGVDSFDGQIERARRHAREAGVADRVRFELLDAADGLPGCYELITTFDVLHDAIDPPRLLRSIRRALAPDGIYLIAEMNCADDPVRNVGPLGTLMYGISMLFCMTTSLAGGGAGLGTCGCPPGKVRDLCTEAGFSSVERLAVEDPLKLLYAVRP